MSPSDPFAPDASASPGPAAEADILDRIDALVPPTSGGIVPSADIWDEDDEEWLPDAQTVVHGPDGEPLEEPLDDPVYDGRTDEAMASRMARWGRESVLGAGLVGVGRGIENVLQPKEPTEIVIEVDAERSGPDDPVTLYLVDVHPEQSVAVVRPWLLGRPRRRRRRRSQADQPELG
jgi:hypothetical protein